jgi:hypothetical protein
LAALKNVYAADTTAAGMCTRTKTPRGVGRHQQQPQARWGGKRIQHKDFEQVTPLDRVQGGQVEAIDESIGVPIVVQRDLHACSSEFSAPQACWPRRRQCCSHLDSFPASAAATADADVSADR